MAEDICYHDENTLEKVRDCLRQNLGLSPNKTNAIVSAMQKRGILFRERLPYINEDDQVREETARG